MATLNQWFGIGRLGKDPDISTVKNKLLAKFSLAVDQKDNQTMWLQVTAWEKQAEFVQKYAHKGTASVEKTGEPLRGDCGRSPGRT